MSRSSHLLPLALGAMIVIIVLFMVFKQNSSSTATAATQSPQTPSSYSAPPAPAPSAYSAPPSSYSTPPAQPSYSAPQAPAASYSAPQAPAASYSPPAPPTPGATTAQYILLQNYPPRNEYSDPANGPSNPIGASAVPYSGTGIDLYHPPPGYYTNINDLFDIKVGDQWPINPCPIETPFYLVSPSCGAKTPGLVAGGGGHCTMRNITQISPYCSFPTEAGPSPAPMGIGQLAYEQ
jgi:hypothetical protein